MESELRYWREQFVSALALHYSSRESQNILKLVLDVLGFPSETEFLVHKEKLLNNAQEDTLRNFLAEASTGKPVQYILGSCFFDGMQLKVGPGVLIPRPETEELVQWIKSNHSKGSIQSICDLGTGSGCIILALAKHFTDAACIGVDLSSEALEIANENKKLQDLGNVQFIPGDILDESLLNTIQFDLIVSNPPYIPVNESHTISAHIKEHEPHLALFTPNEDPLIFYSYLAAFSHSHLKPGGSMYVEVHEKYATETAELFRSLLSGNVSIQKDMQEKNRMILIKRD